MQGRYALSFGASLGGVVLALAALHWLAPSFISAPPAALLWLAGREMLLAASLYFLSRSYGLEAADATLTSLVAALSGYILYFQTGDAGCQAALASTFFAWGALRRLATGQAPPVEGIVAAFFIFLSLLTGRAIDYAALGAIVAVLCAEDIARGGRRAGWLAAAAVLSVALYWPAAGQLTEPWSNAIMSYGRLTPTVGQVLNLSNPLWTPHVPVSEGAFLTPAPIYFLAWFVLPLLFFIDWRGAAWRKEAALLILCGVFLFLSVGAERMGPVHWPLDWLPYVQAGALLSLFRFAAQRPLVFNRSRLSWAMAALAVTTYAAVMENPVPGTHGLPLFLLCAAFVALLPKMRTPFSRRIFLGATSALMPLVLISLYPDLHGYPADLPAPRALFAARHSWAVADFLPPAAAMIAWVMVAVQRAPQGRRS